jgi:hypothetical protein
VLKSELINILFDLKGPIQAIVVITIIWVKIGPTFLSGLLVLLLTLPTKAIIAKMQKKLK